MAQKKQIKQEVKSTHDSQPNSSWQLQDAKARFSELFRAALSKGPQRVNRQGGGEVVVISADEFAEMLKKKKSNKSLVRFFAESPLKDCGIDLERAEDPGREIDL